MSPPAFELLGENTRLPAETQTQLRTLAQSLAPHTALPEVQAFYTAARTGTPPQIFDALRALQGSTNAALSPMQDSIRGAAMNTGHFLNQVVVSLERGVELAATPFRGQVGTAIDQAARNVGLPSPAQGIEMGLNVYRQLPSALRIPVLGGVLGGSMWLLSWPMQWLGFRKAAQSTRTMGRLAWTASKWGMIAHIIADFLQRGFVGGIQALTPTIARPYIDPIINYFRSNTGGAAPAAGPLPPR